MGNARLVGLGRNHPHIIREGSGDALHSAQPVGMDAVVICYQNAQGRALSGSRNDHIATAHIRSQSLGNGNRAIGALIVFHHRYQATTNRHA